MPPVELEHWNEFLRLHPDAHFLQTGEWGELKAAFGWDVARLVVGQVGVQILFRRLPLGVTLAYLPRPIRQVCVQEGESGWKAEVEQLWREVDALGRARQAVFLKVEPDIWEQDQLRVALPGPFAVRRSPHTIQPPRTIVVDLRGSEEEILARMKQKTRYNIRLAIKKGVTVRPWEDLDAFHAMMQITGQRDGFGVHTAAYYRRAWELFRSAGLGELLVAEFEGQPLAALMVFARGRRAWYVYGASSDRHRHLMPTYLVQWEAMRWARARGAVEYDLWGVPDEDETTLEAQFESRHEGLWGVYRFKRGFGGSLMRAEQALDRVYRPGWYQIYLWGMRWWQRRQGV